MLDQRLYQNRKLHVSLRAQLADYPFLSRVPLDSKFQSKKYKENLEQLDTEIMAVTIRGLTRLNVGLASNIISKNNFLNCMYRFNLITLFHLHKKPNNEIEHFFFALYILNIYSYIK